MKRKPPIPLDQMPDNSTETLSRLSSSDLTRYTASWRVGSEHHIAGMAELRRREAKPTATTKLGLIWIPLALLVVAMAAFFVGDLEIIQR